MLSRPKSLRKFPRGRVVSRPVDYAVTPGARSADRRLLDAPGSVEKEW